MITLRLRRTAGHCLTVAVLMLPVFLPVTGCNGKDDTVPSDSGTEEAVPVKMTAVRTMTLTETVRGIGTLRALKTVKLRPEISGILLDVHFEGAQEVSRGELLFSIDDNKLQHQLESHRAALQAAQARLEDAERRFRRLDNLLERQSVSRESRDQAQTAYATAKAEVSRHKAQVALVKEQLKDTRIEAPFDGVVSETFVDAGNYLEVGQHLATLYRTDVLETAFSLPERHMGRIRAGQDVEVMVDAYPEEVFPGSVTYVSPSVNERTRDFRVKARIKNPDLRLKPGAFATAVVTVKRRRDQPVVPEDALVAVRTGYVVYVVRDAVAHQTDVTIGLRQDGMVQVVTGLTAGADVVTSGQMNVSEGTRVKTVEDDVTESVATDGVPQPAGAAAQDEE